MKRFVFFCLYLLSTLFQLQAQQGMERQFGYLFKNKTFSDTVKGQLFLVQERKIAKTDTVGYFTLNRDSLICLFKSDLTKDTFTCSLKALTIPILKNDSVCIPSPIPKAIASEKLIGVIKNRNEDTLFIKFWDIKDTAFIKSKKIADPHKGLNTIVNSDDNGEDFYFVIRNWDLTSCKRYKYLDIPYRMQQLTATNLPFRILLFGEKNGTVETDFLNANVSYMWVYGHTRIYESEFVKPKNRYIAQGPYMGLSAIDNKTQDRTEFGLNYGWSVAFGMQSWNLILGAGLQNGFSNETKKIQPYVGFGIGFDLIETFSPEVENKE
ncbi:MAG: hypothetical protein K1X92_01315 [Bacteroidia bacterium]|nr:hypothetical protein [Bacteroidia bacterium]